MNYEQELRDHYRNIRLRIASAHQKAIAKKPITMQAMKPRIDPTDPEKRPSDPRMAIVYDCAQKHGVSIEEIFSECRRKIVVRARHEAMWLIYQRKPASTTTVGRFFNRDHTSVLHALKSYKKMDDNVEPQSGGGVSLS